GDPGHGRPPEEFMAASSIGQVIADLATQRTWREETPGGSVYFPTETPIKLAGWRTLLGGSHHDHDSTWGIDEIGEYSEGYGEESGDAFVKEMVEEGGYYHVPSIGWVFVASRGGHELGGSVDAIVIPVRFVLCAAADHCLGAAYRGECPGVDPDALMRWRAESRAKFQGRSVEEVLADVERAQDALRAAPELVLSEHLCEWHLVRPGSGGDCVNAAGTDYSEDPCSAVVVRDMRQPVDLRPTRELPEAAARLGIGYVSGPLVGPDGRQKITCSGTSDQVRAFLDHWALAQGLVDAYGDPERGFAGAYLPEEVAS